MALNCCNWNDKQLDELVDMLKSADYSAVATFIANNFLCSGSRIMTDDVQSNLIATVGTDTKTVVISAGIFVHAGKCSQLDSNQVVNILSTTTGSWGTGAAAHASKNRWSIVCVKNNEQVHTAASRWFVNDSVVPNTYYTQNANTLINKAYYDIVVVHGTDAVSPTVPDAPSGYWTIAEVYVPAAAGALLTANVYDTTDTSNKTPANWTSTSRVLRMEFWSTKFNVDHDPTTGYHRSGLWHIGSTLVTTNATEMNQALDGIGGTVTAANLTKLTDGSSLVVGELHQHGALGAIFNVYDASGWSVPAGSWINMPTFQISITTVEVASFLLLYTHQNSTIYDVKIRFTLDGVPLNPSQGYHDLTGAGGASNPTFNAHGVALSVPAGAHVLMVQGFPAELGSNLIYRQFTVVKI